MYIQEQVEKLIQPILKEHEAELDDIRITKAGNKHNIQVFVDKKGGITLGECTKINKKLGDVLEKTEAINVSYILEVSSPGLDKPLKSKKDFKKVIGKKVSIYTSERIFGRDSFEAELELAEDEFICIKTDDKLSLTIPYDKINKAKVILDF